MKNRNQVHKHHHKNPVIAQEELPSTSLGELRDPKLAEIADSWSAKKRQEVAANLERWAFELKASIENYRFDVSPEDFERREIKSIFEVRKQKRNSSSASLARFALVLRFWAKELELELERRAAQKTIGNPLN